MAATRPGSWAAYSAARIALKAWRAAATLLATRGLTTALLAAGRLATALRLPAGGLPA